MRVNARLDEATREQLEYLTQATGHSVSHVVRESVACYYAQLRAKSGGMRRFAAVVGKGHSGRSDVASSYKLEVSEAILDKHRRTQGR